jgi:hypothetical protein
MTIAAFYDLGAARIDKFRAQIVKCRAPNGMVAVHYLK